MAATALKASRVGMKRQFPSDMMGPKASKVRVAEKGSSSAWSPSAGDDDHSRTGAQLSSAAERVRVVFSDLLQSDEAKDMTVVDFLKKTVDLLADDIRSRAEASVTRLRSAYQDEERILQDALKSKLAQDEDAAKKSSKTKMSLHLVVEAGPYKGETFIVKPRARRRVARLGRSTGSDYTRHGVSLADDPEVSTYHGKFESSGGNVYFTDVGSTNGSILNGTELVANERMHLRNGDMLKVGATDMRVSVQSDDADGAASASTSSSAATRSTVRRGDQGSSKKEGGSAKGGAAAAEDEEEDEDEDEDEEEEGSSRSGRGRKAGGRSKAAKKADSKSKAGGKRRTRRG